MLFYAELYYSQWQKSVINFMKKNNIAKRFIQTTTVKSNTYLVLTHVKWEIISPAKKERIYVSLCHTQ